MINNKIKFKDLGKMVKSFATVKDTISLVDIGGLYIGAVNIEHAPTIPGKIACGLFSLISIYDLYRQNRQGKDSIYITPWKKMYNNLKSLCSIDE